MCAKSSMQQLFRQGDQVRLRSDPRKTGVILDAHLSREHGWTYRVFFSSDDQDFVAEEDLLPAGQTIVDGQVVDCGIHLDDLRRGILLAKLRSPHGESLYSLHASRVEFHVYQFKPVLKFLRNPDHRILIADEVGLGKTIEAGIIMTELQARLDHARVLVACPASLRAKWRDEMQSRFEEGFEEMDAQAVKRFLKSYRKFGETTPLKGIVSLELLRRQEFIAQLAEDQVHFDLVIVDEAHHCRNPDTNTNDLVTVLGESADAMLLLTATPLHLGNQDLFHLLQILDPGEFDDLDLFEERIEPNRHINNASRLLQAGEPRKALRELRKVERTSERRRYISNPYYREVQKTLRQGRLDRDQVLRAQRMLLELNTLAHIFTRTRKREVVTNAPKRVAKVLRFDFKPEERAFYEAVVRFVRQHWLSTMKQSSSVGFALVMRERQAASSIPAFREHYIDVMTRPYLDAEELDMVAGLLEDSDQPEKLKFPRPLQRAAMQLTESAKRVRDTDTKFDLFLETLQEVLATDPGAKVLVFSFFKKTLEYLHERLRALGIRVALIHGDVAVRDRHGIIERFRDTKEIRVLLSSEVGSEGIDLQFCHVLFNYDLPWNPMKVEQRIGRIDRFGQRSRKIFIYNFVASGTIEDRIYARLYERIRIFEESIGDLEAILGDVLRDLTRKVYRRELSPLEEMELAEQAANTVLRKKQELEEFEKHKLEFMGQDAIFEQDIRNAVETGRYVSKEELHALVSTYLETEFPRTRLEKNVGEDTWCLEPCQELLQAMRAPIFDAGRANPAHLDFLRRLRQSKSIPLTFSNELANERKLVEYVNLRHALATAAVAHWQDRADGDHARYVTHLQAGAGRCGRFLFFLFGLRTSALRVEEKLVPVVISADTMRVQPSLNRRFLRIVQEGQQGSTGDAADLNQEEFERAQQVAVNYMARLRTKTQKEARRLNDALVNSRLASLERSYEVRHTRVRRTLAKVTEPRIRRMRQAQLRNLEARYVADSAELEASRTVTTTFSEKLAGVLWLHPHSQRASQG